MTCNHTKPQVSTVSRPSSNGHPAVSNGYLLSIKDAASYIGTSVSTLRLLSNENIIPTTRLCGHNKLSHRRYTKKALQQYIGEWVDDEPEQVTQRKVFAYARCSSAAGNKNWKHDKEDGNTMLASQCKRLRDYAKEHYGIENLTIYSEIKSGCNFERKELDKMMTEIIEDNYSNGLLLLCHKDRLSRVGISLFYLLFRLKNIEVIEIDDSEIKDESIVEIICAIMVSLTSRLNGKRSGARRKINLSSEILVKSLRLQQRGMPIREIVKTLEKDGDRCSRGRVIKQSTLTLNMKAFDETFKEVQVGMKDKTVVDFINEMVVKVSDDKKKIQHCELEKIYLSVCIRQNRVPLRKGKLIKAFHSELQNKLISGKRYYTGIEIVTKKGEN